MGTGGAREKMTIKVYKTDGKIEEYPNANITWEWDENEKGTDSGWHINAIYAHHTVSGFIYPSDCQKIEITHEECDQFFKMAPTKSLSKGASCILKERIRQIVGERFTAEHDDFWNKKGELVKAAMCYCMESPNLEEGDEPCVPDGWPWGNNFWKPTPKNRIRELEKAGALIAAEIDRLLRLEEEI